MNICIFPGSFNPIHNGHLQMADYVLEKYNFDKVIFIPSYIPPHKEIDKNLAIHRLNMVKLATAGNDNFAVSDIEYKYEGKSYSVNTVKKINEMYNVKGLLNFIIGTDAFEKLDSWYKSEELKKMVNFIVFPRGKLADDYVYADLKTKGWHFEIADFTPADISSTKIRNSCDKSMINKDVEEYIRENELYKY